MSTFLLRIVTPDGEKYKGEAEKLFFRASDGDVGIMANHADYIAAVDICHVRIITGAEELSAVCGGGFITFYSNTASLVCDTFVLKENINKEEVMSELEEAEKKLLEAKNPREKGILNSQIKRLKLYMEI
ncbi:MAG: F0F1 ATP synthase subunit epsilon [Ruminococcaceae bacterium]|nr:F0F1 ATP synthase subunit epsilon [Oscillospiraceae bacterium]